MITYIDLMLLLTNQQHEPLYSKTMLEILVAKTRATHSFPQASRQVNEKKNTHASTMLPCMQNF